MDNSKVDIGIPPGKYEIVIGDSYKKGPDRKDFHTLKLDFKPKSVATEQEAYIAFNQKEDVQMVLPGEASDWTVYQGNKREPKGAKECLLIYDKKTNQLKLEKLTSNIVVKKVRGKIEEKLDDSVRAEIMRRHSKRVQEREAMKALQSDKSPQSENNDSSESSDGSGSESSSDSDSDEERQKPADTGMESDTHDPNFLSEDELESALEMHLETQRESLRPSVSPEKKATSSSNSHQKILHDDLKLSESDDSDDD